MDEKISPERENDLFKVTAREWQTPDLHPDLSFCILDLHCGLSGCMSGFGEGPWGVLVEGPKCHARRLAFLLKARKEAQSHLVIYL